MTKAPAVDRRTFLGAAAALTIAPKIAEAAVSKSTNTIPLGSWSERGTISRPGGQLAWQAFGPKDGEPVVLLHKLGGRTSDWRGVAPLLGANRRVIAFDLPGHGDSTMLGAPPYVQTVSETAAMLLAALDELGIERASFVGSSLGGIVATQIAALWPQRVHKLVLASVALSRGYDRAKLKELEVDRDPDNYDADWRPLPRAHKSSSSGLATMIQSVAVEEDASRAVADRWLRPSERGAGLNDTHTALGRTIAPLLFIYADRGIYLKYLEVGKALRNDCQIVRFEETGSFTHQERPVDFAAAIRLFLDAAG